MVLLACGPMHSNVAAVSRTFNICPIASVAQWGLLLCPRYCDRQRIASAPRMGPAVSPAFRYAAASLAYRTPGACCVRCVPDYPAGEGIASGLGGRTDAAIRYNELTVARLRSPTQTYWEHGCGHLLLDKQPRCVPGHWVFASIGSSIVETQVQCPRNAMVTNC